MKDTEETARVCELTVISDNADFRLARIGKAGYYDTPCVKDFAMRVSNKTDVQCGSLVFDWRGCLAREGDRFLRECGLSRREIEIITVRSLSLSAGIRRAFQESNDHYDSWERPAAVV